MELILIGFNVDKSIEMYSSENCQMILNTYDEYYQKIGYNLPWVGYFIIKENKIVGSCGFTGQPKNGIVEIAYWTFNEWEGQGIASFACRELVLFSQQYDPGIIITAKTAPEQSASTSVLTKNGFAYTEMVQNEEIGEALLWTLQ